MCSFSESNASRQFLDLSENPGLWNSMVYSHGSSFSPLKSPYIRVYIYNHIHVYINVCIWLYMIICIQLYIYIFIYTGYIYIYPHVCWLNHKTPSTVAIEDYFAIRLWYLWRRDAGNWGSWPGWFILKGWLYRIYWRFWWPNIFVYNWNNLEYIII